MSSNHWIKLHRSATRWEWYRDSKMFHLFFHLVINANWKQGKFKGHIIKRGQIVVGRRELAAQTGISEQSVRTCLNKLLESGEITVFATNRFSVVTVLNYDKYQCGDRQDQPTNQPTNQPTTNQQLTTIKEGKEGKEEKIVCRDGGHNGVPHKVIVDFLNEQIGSSFKHTAKATRRHIKARFNEGFTLDDFKTVIESKTEEWKGDSRMNQYLRPITLFGTNFEGYLEAAKERHHEPKFKWIDKNNAE